MLVPGLPHSSWHFAASLLRLLVAGGVADGSSPFLLWGIVFVPFALVVPSALIGDCGITFLTANILLATAYVVVLFLQIRARTIGAA